MFKLVVFIFAVPAAVFGAVQPKPDAITGYYWRDFTGHIPEDALQGGTDEKKVPIYIGQVFFRNFVIPVRIYPKNNTVRFEYGFVEHETEKNIKILCTQHPGHFEWIKTDNHKLHFLTDKHLVVGGAQQNWAILIGRTKQCEDTIIGKIALHKDPKGTGMYVSHKGNIFYLMSFEVLAYNPKKNK